MTPPLHEVHFLTLAVAHNRRGWVTPLELPPGSQRAATHVVPVDSTFGLFPRYRVEFAKCSYDGSDASDWTEMVVRPTGLLTVIGTWSICFQLRMEQGQPVIFDYVGSLTHEDFRFPLAEIVPEEESQLEELYVQQHIVIVGCDPMTSYGGTTSVLQTNARRGA